MKTGKTLIELATEITRQAEAKRDFLAPISLLKMTENAELEGFNCNALPLNKIAHNQVATHFGIPAKYYDKMMAETPVLLAENVNTWIKKDDSEARMIRTLDGKVRAFLSNRYRPLDNSDLAEAVLPVLNDLGVMVLSAEITESRFYIKAVDKRILRDLPYGAKLGEGNQRFDTLSPALIISNSEVGHGSFNVAAGIYTGGCTNLAQLNDRTMRKYHVGSKHEVVDGLYELLSDSTKRLSDAATWAQVRDVCKAAFERAKFDAHCDKLIGLTERKITGDVVKAIEITAKKFVLAETEKSSVLKHLIEGGDLSQYGLFNAVTRTAEDLEDYDRANEFEKMGGQIIELPKSDWQQISEAA